MKLTRTIKTREKKYLGTSKSFDSICSEINKNQFVKELKGREKLSTNSTGSSRLSAFRVQTNYYHILNCKFVIKSRCSSELIRLSV